MVVDTTEKQEPGRVVERRGAAVLAVLALLLAAVGTAQATHTTPDTFGHTTVEQRVDGGDPEAGYQELGLVGGEDYVVRDPLGVAQPGRESTRKSLNYFAQMTDFQLADEESPARVEFVDPGPSSAWRPQEAFVPFMVEYTVRQVNAFAADSPFPGSSKPMDFALITGDQADNNHRNETVWIRELLEGGDPVNFNSGLSDAGDYADPASLGATCPAFVTQEGGAAGAAAEGAGYTGVQDHSDYNSVNSKNYFYDPNQVGAPQADPFEDFPQWTGLMDRAQQVSFTPQGLAVPFYLANGNHDVLVQGNEDANAPIEAIALGCSKVFGPTVAPPGASLPDPDFPGTEVHFVPPDPQRQFVSKPQIKQIYSDGADPAADPQQGHGFGLVDPAENAASNGSASYYSWEPIPGMQFISIDTNSEGGQTAEGVAPGSSNGNLDDPQFQWLKGELEAAQAANKLIVLFGHHPVRSMNTPIIDEQASPCTVDDSHGHDINPGCDLDPRASTPIHLGDEQLPGTGQTFVELLEGYPNVIAYVPGHTHEHRLTPFQRRDGSLWWELNTSAVVDHPTQSRLIEIFDNQDGTLSIFTNVIDHGSSATAPDPGSAAGFDENQLASIGRTLAYNDPQNNFSGEGAVEDRNAELLLGDPRDDNQGGSGPKEKCKGKQATIVGTGGKDTLEGTSGDDVIVAKGGKDKIRAGKGKDVICGNGGKDKLSGNGGKDKVRGGGGGDKLKGGGGGDKLKGGAGKDRMRGGGGTDSCGGGAGRDVGRSCEQGRDADG